MRDGALGRGACRVASKAALSENLILQPLDEIFGQAAQYSLETGLWIEQICHVSSRNKILDQNLGLPVPVYADLRDIDFRCLVWREQDIIMRRVFLIRELCGRQVTAEMIAPPGRDVYCSKNFFILNIPACHRQ